MDINKIYTYGLNLNTNTISYNGVLITIIQKGESANCGILFSLVWDLGIKIAISDGSGWGLLVSRYDNRQTRFRSETHKSTLQIYIEWLVTLHPTCATAQSQLNTSSHLHRNARRTIVLLHPGYTLLLLSDSHSSLLSSSNQTKLSELSSHLRVCI